ncbi:MAP-homologous protein 1 [Frankliniella fusca]|uniref:MAP-homologous protein 1 n=1 Tax=Frankliniella fusca TaxID=407009 RepID=A0AAE1H8U2_9NEOP|nr:MAP-homologous protein 1 [Frankliniella fusca]
MLTLLETSGISIETSEGLQKIYFVTSLLLGDNLGVNSLGGFVESFTANFFCRFCKSKRIETFTQTEENCSLLRDEISHAEDVLLNDCSLTGVKSNCVLDALPSFSITSNYCVDSFHDLMEGCCHYTMLHILKHCVPKYFTIDLLNNRISLYKFGPCESNRVPPLRIDFDKKEKLKMSGSETFLFVKHFGLLIGDRVLTDDPYWHLYVKMRELLDIVVSKCLSKSSRELLRIIVRDFCMLYLSVTGDTLKPKMHFLLHYSTVFAECGTFELMSTKKFERKHRALLVPAHGTMSRTCITKTIAIKHQLDFSFRLMARQSILPSITKGPSMTICISELDCYNAIVSSLPKSIIMQSSSCLSLNWVLYKGTKYKPGMVLLLDVKECGPLFGVIEFILSADTDDLTFVFSYMVTFGFDEHIVAYEVDHTNVYSSVSPDNLYDPLPLSIHHSVSDDKYVILRYSL